MALDSARKRSSTIALGYGQPPSIYTPDATKPQGWRQSVGYGYYGINVGVVSWSTLGETINGTTTAEATQVTLNIGPIALSANDILRIQGKFSAMDTGSNWLDAKCVLRIVEIQ
jgi:hypothetical protein